MIGLIKSLIITHSYIANYGYSDGSGDYYIIVDSDKCDGCGKCVEACPSDILEVFIDDYDDLSVKVKDAHKKSIKYDCSICFPVGRKDARCEPACPLDAITTSVKVKGSD